MFTFLYSLFVFTHGPNYLPYPLFIATRENDMGLWECNMCKLEKPLCAMLTANCILAECNFRSFPYVYILCVLDPRARRDVLFKVIGRFVLNQQVAAVCE